DEMAQDAEDAAMSHYHGMPGQFAGEIDETHGHVVIIFAALGAKLPIGLVALTGRDGLFAGDFGMETPFEIAEGNLDEAGIVNDGRQLDIKGRAHAVHGFAGAAERGGKPFERTRIDAIALQQLPEQWPVRVGLQLADAIERNVSGALIPLFAVPV